MDRLLSGLCSKNKKINFFFCNIQEREILRSSILLNGESVVWINGFFGRSNETLRPELLISAIKDEGKELGEIKQCSLQ